MPWKKLCVALALVAVAGGAVTFAILYRFSGSGPATADDNQTLASSGGRYAIPADASWTDVHKLAVDYRTRLGELRKSKAQQDRALADARRELARLKAQARAKAADEDGDVVLAPGLGTAAPAQGPDAVALCDQRVREMESARQAAEIELQDLQRAYNDALHILSERRGEKPPPEPPPAPAPSSPASDPAPTAPPPRRAPVGDLPTSTPTMPFAPGGSSVPD